MADHDSLLGLPAERMTAPSSARPAPSPQAVTLVRLLLGAAAVEGVLVALALAFGDVTTGGASLRHLGLPRALALAATAVLTATFLWLSIKASADESWRIRSAEAAVDLAATQSTFRWLMTILFLLSFLNVVAVFGTSLRLNPGTDQLIGGFLRRGGPLVLWVGLLAAQAGAVCAALSRRPAGDRLRALALGLMAFALVLVYWYGAEGQLLYYNVDMKLTDQTAYMDYARLLKASGYSYPGDFNRMPVYPFLLSQVARQGMTDAQFFLAAKYFNLFFSILLLAGLAVVFFGRYSALQASGLLMIVAFTVFIYKAGWVQAELLFYVLNTCLFLLLWRLLERPSPLAAVAAGLVAGMAHLTKASIWPSLFLFAAFAMLRSAELLWRTRGDAPEVRRGSWARPALAVVLAGSVFLLVIAPYIRVSHRLTGRYFYNVNSAFYMWYDSWAQAEAGTKAHGDRLGWPDLPADQIPSLPKYLSEHTPGEIVDRITSGAQNVVVHIQRSYGYPKYVLGLAGLLAVAVVLRWPRARTLAREHAILIGFFVAYFVVYALLYSWWAPIAAGDRLVLAQFIPLLLVLASGVRTVLEDAQVLIAGRSVAWTTLVNLAILGIVTTDALWAVSRGVYILRGGG